MNYKKFTFALTAMACLFGGCAIDNSLHAAVQKNTPKSELIQKVDANSYDAFISKDGVVVVQYYLIYCGPCKRMKKIFEEVAQELSGQASFGKVLLSENRALGRSKNIYKVPTFILYRDGVEVKRIYSADKTTFKNWLVSEL